MANFTSMVFLFFRLNSLRVKRDSRLFFFTSEFSMSIIVGAGRDTVRFCGLE